MTQNPFMLRFYLLNIYSHRTTLAAPENIFHLHISPSPRSLAGQQVRRRQGQPTL